MCSARLAQAFRQITMPRFAYIAIDAAGRERRGALTAKSEAEARVDLQRRKLLPVSLATAGSQAQSKAAPADSNPNARLSLKQLLLVTRQLATLIDAGVPVDEALEMIAAQQENQQSGRILADVHAGITEGQRLAEALARHPKSFSGLYRAAVSGGERSGKLGAVLHRMAEYLNKAAALRAKVTTALIYPAALSLVAFTVISCLMIFVVPTLTEQFRAFDQQLPLITQILMGVSSFLATFWPVIIALLAALFFAARALLQRSGPRAAWDRFVLDLPIIGRQARAVNASRFVRATSMLVAAGLTVLDGVRGGQGAVNNRAVQSAISQMALAIEQGEPLSHAMRASGLVPPMVTYMAASGENAGELPGMLDKAADYLDQEVETFTNSALSLLEPAIIVLMGGIVAGIVLSIMLPILQLNRMAIG
jgi:general secretion pathway protein F